MFDKIYLACITVNEESGLEQIGIHSWISSASASVGFENPATVMKPFAL